MATYWQHTLTRILHFIAIVKTLNEYNFCKYSGHYGFVSQFLVKYFNVYSVDNMQRWIFNSFRIQNRFTLTFYKNYVTTNNFIMNVVKCSINKIYEFVHWKFIFTEIQYDGRINSLIGHYTYRVCQVYFIQNNDTDSFFSN